jgi:hypothetical protein
LENGLIFFQFIEFHYIPNINFKISNWIHNVFGRISDMFNLLFSRFMSYLRTNIQQTQKFILSVPLFVLISVFFCEFLIYYMVIWRCSWPILACTDHTEENESFQRPLRSIILADPHLLGKNAHWLDKLRRYFIRNLFSFHQNFSPLMSLEI